MSWRVFGVAAIASAVVVVGAVIADRRHNYVHSVDFFPAAVLGMAALTLVVIWFGAVSIWAWRELRKGAKQRT